MATDPRSILREADALVRAGDYQEAIRMYARVGRTFTNQGFALKAVALFKQVRDIIHDYAPNETELDNEARQSLVGLYRSLGLLADAQALDAEPAIIRRGQLSH